MACISKLADGFTYNCDTGGTGLLKALILNLEDISGFSKEASSSVVTSITLATGASVWAVDTPKKTVVVTEALKTNENALNGFSHSVTITSTAVQGVGFQQKVLQPLTNARVVIITAEPNGIYRIYGLYYGLSAVSIDRSTGDNGGWYKFTMATPEQVIGEDALQTTFSEFKRLEALAV